MAKNYKSGNRMIDADTKTEMVRVPDFWIAASVYDKMMAANPGAKIIEAVRNTINEVYAPRPWKACGLAVGKSEQRRV